MVTQEPYQFVVGSSSLPIIYCRCGAEILVVPDVKAMGKVIDAHVEGCRLTKHSKNVTKCVAILSEHLIGQVLELAAEVESKESH